MAKRRMFSKDIVNSDTFLSMSLDARLLYYQLGIEADDRGYVNNVITLARICGVNPKCLDELIENKFVLKRNSTLYLIKGWRINNTIQPTRLVESNYVSDLATLNLDENGSYTTGNGISCKTLLTQDSKGKKRNRIGKVSEVEEKEEVVTVDWETLISDIEK